MKKLLTLLGSITITATSSIMVVACGTNYDKKDKDGNSILVHFLTSLDGKAQISTLDALYAMLDQTGRESFALDMLNMISLSILANAKDNWGSTSDEANNVDPLDLKNNYYNYDLASTLSKRWTNLDSQVDAQIANEKKKYQKDYGKKWEKKWNEMLFDKYSVYQDDVKHIDQAFLESKYKADILLTDSKTSASKTLIDVLLNTNQAGVTWVTKSQLTNIYNALLKQNEELLLTTLKSDPLIISQLENSTKESSDKWVAPKTYTTDKELLDDYKRVNELLGDNISKIKSDVPKTIAEFNAFNASETKGFLSNSQRFFLDKWYNTQAPLAISELIIPFAEGKSFDNGIDLTSFQGTTDPNQIHGKQTIKLLKQIEADKDLRTWNESLKSGKNEYIYDGAVGYDWTINKHDSLLTLNNSSYSQDLKTVVYDYVLDDSFPATPDGIPTGTNDMDSLDKFLQSINRKKEKHSHGKESTVYTVIKNGMVAYVDEEGMHIVNIDGFEKFKNSTTSNPTNNGGQQGIDDGQINKKTLTELNSFKKFSKHTDKDKVQIISNPESEAFDVKYNELNTQISNEYLRYLANNSLISGLTNSPVSYDVLSEAKNWAQISASTAATEEAAATSYWITCVLEYFHTISKSNKELDEFIDQFITFVPSDNNDDKDKVEKLATSFKNSINSVKRNAETSGQHALNSGVDKRRKELEKSASTSATYPKEYICPENINESRTIEKVNQKWKIQSQSASYNYTLAPISSTNYTSNTVNYYYDKNKFIASKGGVK